MLPIARVPEWSVMPPSATNVGWSVSDNRVKSPSKVSEPEHLTAWTMSLDQPFNCCCVMCQLPLMVRSKSASMRTPTLGSIPDELFSVSVLVELSNDAEESPKMSVTLLAFT